MVYTAHLSDQQFTFYNEKGYLILPPDFLFSSSDEIAKVQEAAKEVRHWPHQSEKWMHYEEKLADGSIGICRTENWADYNEVLGDLLRGRTPPSLISIIELLLKEPCFLFKEKINYKESGAGGFDPHIDASAYNHIGPPKHLTALVAVDRCDMTNGALEVVEGSHRVAVPLGADMCITPAWVSEQTWTPVPLEPGSILIFGSWLAHRSGPNTSKDTRHLIYATYNTESDGGDKHASYYAHRRTIWPATRDRKPGEKYEEGALVYGYGSPMLHAKETIAETQGSKVSKSLSISV